MNDNFVITYDKSNGTDLSCLTIMKKHEDKVEVINSFFGEEAEIMYDFYKKSRFSHVIVEGRK